MMGLKKIIRQPTYISFLLIVQIYLGERGVCVCVGGGGGGGGGGERVEWN